jgi:hypothetical protein
MRTALFSTRTSGVLECAHALHMHILPSISTLLPVLHRELVPLLIKAITFEESAAAASSNVQRLVDAASSHSVEAMALGVLSKGDVEVLLSRFQSPPPSPPLACPNMLSIRRPHAGVHACPCMHAPAPGAHFACLPVPLTDAKMSTDGTCSGKQTHQLLDDTAACSNRDLEHLICRPI